MQKKSKGIVVGSCGVTEWLLAWWYHHYALHNSYPITFVDFGMSEKAKAFCKEKGNLIPLKSENFVIQKESVEEHLRELWEKIYSKEFWPCRKAWFKKPLAMHLSPYEETLWLDLDCEVRGPLNPLFDHLENNPLKISVAKEPEKVQVFELEKGLILPGEITFNSGVVAFSKHSPVIAEWVEKSLKSNHKYIGDQHILSRILFNKDFTFKELSPLFNWNMRLGPNPEALVLHFVGPSGKAQIQEKIKDLSL